jgi:tetratricopeptide (TPR) repeat protein
MLTEHFSGHVSGAHEIAREFSSQRDNDVVQYSLGSWVVVAESLQRGDIDGARTRLQEWSAVIDPDKMTHFRFLYEISRNEMDTVHGRAQDVVNRMKSMHVRVKNAGCLLGAWDMALWNLSGLEAALRLSESAKLFSHDHKYAVKLAKQVIKRAPIFFQCMAHRGLALLAHDEGDHKKASKHLRAALDLSEQAGVAYYRWLCLEAARKLGPMNASLASETLTLQKDYGYVRL